MDHTPTNRESNDAGPEQDVLTESQKRELDRRLADLDENPNDVLTWDEIKARIHYPR
jgi:putative addiction module component (TIGR02574 family)